MLIEGEPGIGKSALVRAAVAQAPEFGGQVYWGAGDELSQALPLLPFLDGLRVRELSANPRRETIIRLLRGEVTADRGTDGPAGAGRATAGAGRRAVRGSAGHPGRRRPAVGRSCERRPVGTAGQVGAADAAAAGWDDAPGAPAGRPAGAAAGGGRCRPAPARRAERSGGGRPGRRPGRRPPDDDLLRLADGAAGNPLYLTELVAALARGSGLTVTEAGSAELAGGSVPGPCRRPSRTVSAS